MRRYRVLLSTFSSCAASVLLPPGAFPFHDSPYVEQYGLHHDPGRFAVSGREFERYEFRVPTLRNITITAPYFHNGRAATLEEEVRVMASAQLNKTLPDDQVADVVAFLNALTGEFPEQVLPRLPMTPGRSVIEWRSGTTETVQEFRVGWGEVRTPTNEVS